MLLFLQLPRLGEQARIVAVQLGQLVLLDYQGLLQLPQFQLQLLYLRLVSTLFLLTLLLAGLAVVLQGVACMLMLLLQRANLPIAVLQALLQVAVGLQ